jgi:hypothetical protein
MAGRLTQEIPMFKTVAAGAAALMIAAGAAQAQPAPGGPPAGPEGRRPSVTEGRPFEAEDRAARLDMRIAALHAYLQLTPKQEEAWPAFEKTYRDLAALRASHQPYGEGEWSDPVQRAQRHAARLLAFGEALKRYADALEPLYKTFDDGQKRRYSEISMHMRRHHFAFWRGGSQRGDFGFHRGWGPRDDYYGGPGRSDFSGRRGEPSGPDRGGPER